MKHLLYEHQRNVSILSAFLRAVWHTAARVFIPRWTRAVAVLNRDAVRAVAARILLLLALLAQLALLFVLGYLIDLSLSLMELWAELARKHLELTM